MQSDPPVFARMRPVPSVGLPGRVWAILIAIGCLGSLLTAAAIPPSRTGVNTHVAIGLQPCQMLQKTGIPCAACGMTTSFSHFVRGQFLAGAAAQPMGVVLALACGMTFWMAAAVAWSGRPLHRILVARLTPRLGIGVVAFALLSWGWKIVTLRP